MTTRTWARLAAVLAAAALSAWIGGCAYNTGMVVLLPDKDGRDTAVVVKQGSETQVLSKPYAATRQWPMRSANRESVVIGATRSARCPRSMR